MTSGEWEWKDLHEVDEIQFEGDWETKIFFLPKGKEIITQIKLTVLKNGGGEDT